MLHNIVCFFRRHKPKKSFVYTTSATLLFALSAIMCSAVILKSNSTDIHIAETSVFPRGSPLEFAEPIVVEEAQYKLVLVNTKVHITEKEEYTLEFSEMPNEEDIDITWQSSNEDVAKVNENGAITPVADGNAIVFAKDRVSGETAECDVVVELLVEPEEVSLNKTSHTFKKLKKTLQLEPEILPDDVSDKSVTWSSSKEKVATVDENGLVTAKAEGEATITCETVNGLKATCKIKVKTEVKVSSVQLEYWWIRFTGPETGPFSLNANVYPSDAKNKEVKWKSTDENVATVDQNGLVTPIADGTCQIIATAKDGSKKSSSCDIYVVDRGSYVSGSSVYVPVNPEVAANVIEEAWRYVGVIPYVWGGTDLSSGVDCSGFICAIYDRFGYNLWGLRTDLYLAGAEVPSIDQAQAGDILCYSGHVALYDGNGGRIHAPYMGAMVSHDYNIGGYYSIRRIIQ